MIKLTPISSINKTDNNLFLIPGGPGLSSLTLRSLDILKRSFNLFYVDFPGTNGNPYLGKKSFEELSDLLIETVQKIEGDNYILGHSYGGFFAADFAIQNGCAGIICLGTPFSKRSLNGATENYKFKVTPKLENASMAWEAEQTDETFKNWLANYDELYFAPQSFEAGFSLMLNDKVSAKFFLDNRSDAAEQSSLLEAVAQWDGNKLFIAGEDDGLLNKKDLEDDAKEGKFEFLKVKNANHFMMLDQPEIVAGLIESILRQK